MLACAFFYSFPIVIWLSKFDAKIDLGLLFITLCCVLLLTGVSKWNSSNETEGRKFSFISNEMIFWILCGSLLGFTMGIKYTALLNIFAFLIIIFYKNAGKFAAVAVFFLNFALIFLLDLPSFGAFEQDLMLLRVGVPLTLAVVAIGFALKQNITGMGKAFRNSLAFGMAIAILFAPWAIKHVVENQSVSVESILTGKSALPDLYSSANNIPSDRESEIDFVQFGQAHQHVPNEVHSGFGLLASSGNLARHLLLQASTPKPPKRSKISDTKREEIQRYHGYESGFVRFLSLPYDSTMKKNVELWASDMGLLILLILPILMFGFSSRAFHWDLLKICLLLLLLIISMRSVYLVNGSLDLEAIQANLKANGFVAAPAPLLIT